MSLDEQVEAELEQLNKEAKRYRYLRQFGDPDFNPSIELPQEPASPLEFDVAIDLAIIRSGFEKST